MVAHATTRRGAAHLPAIRQVLRDVERRALATTSDPAEALEQLRAEACGGLLDKRARVPGCVGAAPEQPQRAAEHRRPSRTPDVEDVGELVAAEVANEVAREAVEDRAGHRVLHRADQGLGHRRSLGARRPVALGDALPQLAAGGDRRHDQPPIHPEHVADAVPAVKVGVGLVGGERPAELADRVQHDGRERQQREREILLVDGRAPFGIPVVARERQVADGGVHEAHLLRVSDPRAAGGQAAGRHRVQRHLRGLPDPADGVGVQARGQRQHLDAAAHRVARRQRGGREREHAERAVQLEEPLADLDALRVGPVGEVVGGVEVLAHGPRQLLRRHAVVAHERLHDLVHDVDLAVLEDLRDRGVGGRVAGRAHLVEEAIRPAPRRHA